MFLINLVDIGNKTHLCPVQIPGESYKVSGVGITLAASNSSLVSGFAEAPVCYLCIVFISYPLAANLAAPGQLTIIIKYSIRIQQ